MNRRSQEMQAVVIDRYGGNEVVRVRSLPMPRPRADEVLIRVLGASINPLDWKIRNGMLWFLTGRRFPKILGSECAGEVVQTGSGVHAVRAGDPVIGTPGVRHLGAYAEYVCVQARKIFPKPANLSFEQAATLPVAGITALQALRDKGRLAPGCRVLVNGAAGGVGTFAVQIARVLGAEVTAVCSGANRRLAEELGAGRVIDHTREDFTRRPEHYDIVFDAVAKSSFAASKRVLAPKGIYISTLPSPAIVLNQLLTGWVTGRQARTLMGHANPKDMAWLTTQIEGEAIRVVVDRAYPLERTGEALAYSETGKARGKVVITVGRAG